MKDKISAVCELSMSARFFFLLLDKGCRLPDSICSATNAVWAEWPLVSAIISDYGDIIFYIKKEDDRFSTTKKVININKDIIPTEVLCAIMEGYQ